MSRALAATTGRGRQAAAGRASRGCQETCTAECTAEPPLPPLVQGGDVDLQLRRGDVDLQRRGDVDLQRGGDVDLQRRVDVPALPEARGPTSGSPPCTRGGRGGSASDPPPRSDTPSICPTTAHPLARCCLLLVLSTGLPGCRPASGPVDTDRPQAAAVPTDTAASSAKPADEIPIPDGTPDELFQFLQELETREMGIVQDAAASDPAVRGQALRRLMNARVRACDKILATEIAAETRVSAVQMKLDALRTLVAMEPAAWKDAFANFSQQLIDGNDPLLRAPGTVDSLSGPGEYSPFVRHRRHRGHPGHVERVAAGLRRGSRDLSGNSGRNRLVAGDRPQRRGDRTDGADRQPVSELHRSEIGCGSCRNAQPDHEHPTHPAGAGCSSNNLVPWRN